MSLQKSIINLSVQYRIFSLLSCLIFFVKAEAQLGKYKGDVNIYENTWNAGLLFHSNGVGLQYQRTWYKKVNTQILAEVSAFTLKHPKATYSTNPNNQESSSYVFGKLNNTYMLRMLIGGRTLLADNHIPDALRISFNYAAGPELCILKPQYFEVSANPDKPAPKYQKFNKFDSSQHENLIGEAPFNYGLNETSLLFGGSGKASLLTEITTPSQRFYFIEMGVMAEVYPTPIPHFAYDVNQRVFVNLFLAAGLGNRK